MHCKPLFHLDKQKEKNKVLFHRHDVNTVLFRGGILSVKTRRPLADKAMCESSEHVKRFCDQKKSAEMYSRSNKRESEGRSGETEGQKMEFKEMA